ncbi:hypothetical protein L915_03208 [Phytophthora nicotianae]|uniref:Uncharacterized protein n=2 Tax=Phytophthora nicotianae TaxID=4792 RepID=V9FQM7_PHYNI|nr:hypothetical protein F443_03340 [Phytophthora nicotianae P1569]ETK93646.1 hypothetical protein L915_03208 [Phytophthora nicotianae]
MPADVLHELKSDAEYADENERERDLQRAVGPITRSRAKKIALSEKMRAMGGTTVTVLLEDPELVRTATTEV